MNKNLRWKIITILVVFVVFFGIGIYPLLAQRFTVLPAPAWLMQHQLKLGLDLKGGVHLVMRVNTDDASLRVNRLRLLAEIGSAMGAAADFSKIEG